MFSVQLVSLIALIEPPLSTPGQPLRMDERTVRQRYDQVGGNLNLDQQSMDAAWASYKAINNDFGLEVY